MEAGTEISPKTEAIKNALCTPTRKRERQISLETLRQESDEHCTID